MTSDVQLNKKVTDLSGKRAIFVKEYLVDFNGTKAAERAGYSKKTAAAAASRLLRDVKVAAAIEAATSQRCEKLEVEADKVLGELLKLGFANMLDYITIKDGEAYIDFSALTRDQAAAIQEITSETYKEVIPPTPTGEKNNDGDPILTTERVVKRTKFKLFDKRGSLELLGRNLKLFTDKIDLNANLHGSLKLDPTQRLERVAELLARAVKNTPRKSK
jgi:phage terminase small subunit